MKKLKNYNGPLTFVPGKEVNAHRYFDVELNMMFEKPYSWEGQDSIGIGDALIRTGRAYIAWGRKEMKDGIISCFRKFQLKDLGDKYWYQGSRCSGRYGEDDVSRDQLSGAFYALLVRGDIDECVEIIKHTPFKISRRFNMTLDFWLWTKAIQGKKWGEVLWHISSILLLPIMILWNKFINLMLGYKEVDQKLYNPTNGFKHREKFNKLQKLLDMSFYPSYSIHHMCWYLECVPDSFLKKCVQKIIMWQVEKGNYVDRLLCGDKTVTQEDIDSYIPMTEYRWASKLDGSDNVPLRIPESWDINLIEKLKVNQLDKDMLTWLWEKKRV